jgi:surface protein
MYRVWLGSQAFSSASAFNANIGAWNTASVTNLRDVCAAFGPGGAPPPAGRARRVVDAARAVVRGGTADARARACVRRRVGTRMRGRPLV